MLVDGTNGCAEPACAVRPQDQIADLLRQVENLEEALVSRQRVGVAVGLLAHRLDCSADQAWKLLAWMSQTTNIKVRVVAQVLVDQHSRCLSPDDVELFGTLDGLLPSARVLAASDEYR